MANTIVAVYDSKFDAQNAMDALLASGFTRDEVQMNPQHIPATAETTHAAHGIGHFFRTLFGMDEDTATRSDIYAEAARRGSFVVVATADSDDRRDLAVDVMNRHTPIDIEERAERWRSEGWSAFDTTAPMFSEQEIQKERSAYEANQAKSATSSSQTKIPVVQEELRVGKREVQRGGVRIYQHVTEQPVHEDVQLRQEQVKVERRPVDQPATEADLAAFKEGSVEIRETREEPVVEKTARVVEEIDIGKEVTQDTARIDDTVRKTEVEVQPIGASDESDDYRRHWQTAYGSTGGRFEDYDEAYRYGSTLSGGDRFKSYRWEDVEPDVRKEWEASHPESTWEKVKDAVRYGVERIRH